MNKTNIAATGTQPEMAEVSERLQLCHKLKHWTAVRQVELKNT